MYRPVAFQRPCQGRRNLQTVLVPQAGVHTKLGEPILFLTEREVVPAGLRDEAGVLS